MLRELSLGIALLMAAPAAAQTVSTAILPNGFTQFTDANGKPLINGTVAYYVPSTTTPKNTWQDPYQTTLNPNPITLNGSGEALVWGTGVYREVVKDLNGNLIWDQLTSGLNVSAATTPQGSVGALQYNNSGAFGGLSLGTSSQVLLGNASGPPSWGSLPVAALPGGTTGTGPVVLQNSPTINTPTISEGTLNSPTINTPTVSGGTWANPTFTGTVTMPGGGSGYLLATAPTPTSGISAGQAAFGTTTAAAGYCGGAPYLANDGCFLINVGGNVIYIPYWH